MNVYQKFKGFGNIVLDLDINMCIKNVIPVEI